MAISESKDDGRKWMGKNGFHYKKSEPYRRPRVFSVVVQLEKKNKKFFESNGALLVVRHRHIRFGFWKLIFKNLEYYKYIYSFKYF